MFSSPTPYFKSLRYGYVYLDTLVIVTIDFQGDRVQYALKPPSLSLSRRTLHPSLGQANNAFNIVV